jgi:hypothetical protein
VTLASAAVFCFSIWQEDVLRSDYGRSSSEIRFNVESLRFRIDILKDSAKAFEDSIEGEVSEKRKEVLAGRFDKLKEKMDDLVNSHAANIRNLGKSEFEADRVDRLMPTIMAARVGSIAFFFFGILLWYFNHQRFQDEVAMRDARRAASQQHNEDEG